MFTLPARCVGAAARRTRGVDGRGERRCSEVAAGVEQPTGRVQPVQAVRFGRCVVNWLLCVCAQLNACVGWMRREKGEAEGTFLCEENDVEFN